MPIRRFSKYILLLFVSWFLIHTIVITSDGLIDSRTHTAMGLILGNKVNEDGTLSKRLEQRLNCGLHLYQAGRIKGMIVSGGLGKEGFNEGDKMREYLLENGVPPSVIFTDNQGDNTLLSVENTLALQKNLHFDSVLVISQYYHVSRTKLLFRQRGFEKVGSASPLYFEIRDMYSVFREFFAYYSAVLEQKVQSKPC